MRTEQAPRCFRLPLLLCLAEQHCGPRGPRGNLHRFANRRSDPAVCPAQRNNRVSSRSASKIDGERPSGSPSGLPATIFAQCEKC